MIKSTKQEYPVSKALVFKWHRRVSDLQDSPKEHVRMCWTYFHSCWCCFVLETLHYVTIKEKNILDHPSYCRLALSCFAFRPTRRRDKTWQIATWYCLRALSGAKRKHAMAQISRHTHQRPFVIFMKILTDVWTSTIFTVILKTFYNFDETGLQPNHSPHVIIASVD